MTLLGKLCRFRGDSEELSTGDRNQSFFHLVRSNQWATGMVCPTCVSPWDCGKESGPDEEYYFLHTIHTRRDPKNKSAIAILIESVPPADGRPPA